MGGDGGSEAGRPHVLAVPFPLAGHSTPIIQICSMLIATAGCRVTLACYHKLLPRLSLLIPQAIHRSGYLDVLPIWSELADGWDGGGDWDMLRSQLHAIMEQPPRSLLSHLHSFRSDPSLAFLISDVFVSWTQDLAHQLGIPRLAFHNAGPAEYQVYFHAKDLMKSGILPFKAPPGRSENDVDSVIAGIPGRAPAYHRVEEIIADEQAIMISGLPPLYRRDIPSFLQIEEASDEIFFLFIEHIKTGLQSHMLLVNTLDALDGSLLSTMRSQGIPVHPIGPVLGMLEDVFSKEQGFVRVETALASGTTAENPECLQWLEAQKPGSVIYVAFGTVVILSLTQLKEFAAGLLDAGQPFIWAYEKRGGEDAETIQTFLSTFLEQAQGRGLVLDWAPQKLILQHPAVGAFLTHCGWNSAMESICSGVPMLCLPIQSDQFLNCKLLVEQYKIGMQLQKTNKGGLVSSSQISHLIRELFVGEAGKGIRERAQKLKVAARQSVEPGGSSRATLDAIIKLLNRPSACT